MSYLILFLNLCSLSLASSTPLPRTQEKMVSERLMTVCECYAIDADGRLFYGSSRRSQEQAMQRAIAFCMSGTQMPGTCDIKNCGCR